MLFEEGSGNWTDPVANSFRSLPTSRYTPRMRGQHALARPGSPHDHARTDVAHRGFTMDISATRRWTSCSVKRRLERRPHTGGDDQTGRQTAVNAQPEANFTTAYPSTSKATSCKSSPACRRGIPGGAHLQALNMVDTGFYVPAEKLKRLAELYDYGRTSFRSGARRPQPRLLRKTRVGVRRRRLGITATDYMRFCQMLLNAANWMACASSPRSVDSCARRAAADHAGLSPALDSDWTSR